MPGLRVVDAGQLRSSYLHAHSPNHKLSQRPLVEKQVFQELETRPKAGAPRAQTHLRLVCVCVLCLQDLIYHLLGTAATFGLRAFEVWGTRAALTFEGRTLG